MFPTKNKSTNRWAAILAAFFLLLFSVVLGRFFYLAQVKVVNGHELLEVAEDKWKQVKEVDAKRGTIFGRHKRVFAEDIPSYTVYAVLSEEAPEFVKNEQKTASKLAPIIGMSESEIMNLLNRERYRIELGPGGRKISYEKMKSIKALDLPGIGFIKTTNRYYPNQKFASYITGFTNYNNEKNKQVGVLGIERSLNKYLSESDGKVAYIEGFKGNKRPNTKHILKKPDNGANVHLTIDYRIQTILEASMNKVVKKYDPKRIMGVVADPDTGQILAMSNRPSYNPNKRNITNYNNYVISSPYEPGSVMKTFTLAAAINEGVWPGQQTFDSGEYELDSGTVIHDWQGDWGTITFRQGFIRSSNVAFSKVVEDKLGFDRFYNYLKRFGFTKKTGIDLPNESDSIINYRWPIDKIMTGYGQASAFTAIQIVQAATAIANNGKMMQPYIINKVVDPDTDEVLMNHKSEVSGTPISKETAAKVRELMRQVVVDKHGTGHRYDLEDYKVIGKTGTAQIAVNGEGYLTGKGNYIYSFLGMAPKKDPEVIVYIAVDRPNLKIHQVGSMPVSEIFNPVMKNALQYLNIKPDSQPEQVDMHVDLENYEGESLTSVKSTLEEKGLNVVTLGDGEVTQMIPYPNTRILKGSRVVLVGEAPYAMPDVTGWSLTDALKIAEALSLEPNIIGNGFVVNQKPTAGSSITKDDYLALKLKPPKAQEKTSKNKNEVKNSDNNTSDPQSEMESDTVTETESEPSQ